MSGGSRRPGWLRSLGWRRLRRGAASPKRGRRGSSTPWCRRDPGPRPGHRPCRRGEGGGGVRRPGKGRREDVEPPRRPRLRPQTLPFPCTTQAEPPDTGHPSSLRWRSGCRGPGPAGVALRRPGTGDAAPRRSRREPRLQGRPAAPRGAAHRARPARTRARGSRPRGAGSAGPPAGGRRHGSPVLGRCGRRQPARGPGSRSASAGCRGGRGGPALPEWYMAKGGVWAEGEAGVAVRRPKSLPDPGPHAPKCGCPD